MSHAQSIVQAKTGFEQKQMQRISKASGVQIQPQKHQRLKEPFSNSKKFSEIKAK